ncbi:MAG TPA: ABC transporter permease subunit [Blastocatellia bacterium]|nr:ABC transporter permease subunit [Blastocatellia bacterium]HMV84349.1 ABC transporter permease subunit [Blastocatellia bacterium]HMX26511.1 ABC transporter permease subunit [Blastocatellia bacterium]HMY72906.1 ABC transporter permease subunit [Blastocatellia bacterium]HMZ19675.1 ABC transporter permease subunit [Blastocatellia bacterium]
MPQNYIGRLRLDSRGYLWICAGDGLARFDGYSFVNYDQTKGLPKTAIITYINGYTNSKAEFIETFKSGARKILSLKGERKIRVYGDLAFVIGDMTDVSKMGGRDSQLYYRWSLVLAKRQDRRQVVSYHCTTIASPRKQIEAEITKATDEAMDALAHNDVAGIDRLFADSYVVTQGNGSQLRIPTLRTITLPALTLALAYMGFIARLVRSGLIAELGQDYVRTAQAKGLPEWRVIFVHALRGAILTRGRCCVPCPTPRNEARS